MTTARTLTRSVAVLGAATALGFAGAGAAMAATTTHEVEDTTINVTFAKDGLLDADLCFAAVMPTGAAPSALADIQAATALDIDAIIDLVEGESAFTLLTTNDVIPNPFPTVALGDVTVSATVEPNVYTLVSKCSGEDLVVNPAVIVGDPLEAIQGSVGALSSDTDALGTLSSALGGEESDLGGILSSALGGAEGEGSPLDSLSSGMGGGESVPE